MLVIVGMPINVLPHSTIAAILEGGASVCRDAGIPLAGGHRIDSVEPIYGLVAIGIVDPRQLGRNADAQAGDVLILGKPLGVGIVGRAQKNCFDASWLRRHDQRHHPTEPPRPRFGPAAWRARSDGCHRLWPAGPRAGDGQGCPAHCLH